jgi:NCS1 family nucleobase:cation symporter-1
VLARASFGIRGANLPALLRAIVACGWFGIQAWIGGAALFQLVHIWLPSLEGLLPDLLPQNLGLTTAQAACFLAFWSLNMLVVHKGIDSIRRLLLFKSFVLPAIAVLLVAWAVQAVDGLGPILSKPARWQTSGEFWSFFFPALTGVVGFWATVSLNIPDFTRYATSQRAHMLGQALALPTAMTGFAFVGVAVTSATALLFGTTIWDPVAMASRFDSPVLVSVAMLAVGVSTLATNVAANIVSPANDFANLAPRHIDFRRGGYLTGLLGILMMPWRLVSDPSGYIFTWLIAYSSLLGPIGGIMIADYFVVRRQVLVVEELYRRGSRYWFQGGVNLRAVVALVAGVLPNVPGFLAATRLWPKEQLPAGLVGLYDYAWFVGFAVSGAVYLVLTKLRGAESDG